MNMKKDQAPLIPLLDQYSQDVRMSAEINAEIELKKLQKEDEKFLDPMMAYKFKKESEICPW